MRKNELLLTLTIISVIFLVGFFLRVESTHLSGIPSDEKAYYQDQNAIPYMYELDSYYNYRLTENYLEHGYLGDVKISGINWDMYSYYPPGRSAEYPPLLIYVAAFFYKFVNIFINVPLVVTCFWLPAVIGPLTGVVAYLFVRRYSNEYGAFAAGVLTITIPFYFFRTVPGWFDTDMFNILFPLLIMWFTVEAIQTKNNSKKVFFALLTAFSTFIFSMAWEGWIYAFYMVLFVLVIYTVLNKLKKFENRNTLEILGLFLISTVTLLLLTGGNLEVFLTPFNFISTSAHASWPTIFVSVSELGKTSFEELVSGLSLTLLIGLFSLLWMFRILINKNLKATFLNKISWFFYLFLILWILIGVLSLKEGSRFMMLLIPPLVVSSGIMVGICVDYIKKLQIGIKLSVFKNGKDLTKILAVCFLILFLTPAILNVYGNFSNLTPGADDDLWNSATWINNNTSNDTVIITDWSHGYFFSAFASRPVSVDGGSQNSPRTYWINKAFSTSNESLSYGIFRMIATSGDEGYNSLNNYTNNTTRTVEILDNTLGLDKQSAEDVLIKKYHIDYSTAGTVLNFTHPANPKHFIVVNTGLKGMYWTFYFGEWNFITMKGYDCTYSHGNITGSSNHFETTNGVTIDHETGTAKWQGEIPYSLITVENGVVTKKYLNTNSDNCIVLQMDTHQDLVISKEFENSTFIKMVLERNNMTYFNMVYGNEAVSVWEPKNNN
jgi:dolichyl-diphosphooligosaccharide--protein glycosyltransferase